MVVGGGIPLYASRRVRASARLRHRSGLSRKDIIPILVGDYRSHKFAKSLGHGQIDLRKVPAKLRRPLPVTNSRKLAHSYAQSLALITAAFEVIAGDIIGLRRVLLRKADHSFSAITEAVTSAVNGAHLIKS
jgi:hypothetical protein